MSEKEQQIKQMYNDIVEIIDNHFDDSTIITTSIMEDMYNKGYHKTIWHKVADGDLPDIGKEVLCYDGENFIVCKRDIIDWYDTNEFCYDVIAWAELPQYKE